MRRIRNFIQGVGGGGGSRSDGRKTVWTTSFFFALFFYSPELILQLAEGVQWFYYRENYIFLMIQNFPGGGGLTFSLC